MVDWYQVHKRDLPWRHTRDPYKIWLSEIILQQTRVVQGLPYFQRFVKQYPTVMDLAQAPEEEVMRLWQGLGYYTRARNMHACARMVATVLDGKFPDNYQDLLRLQGVGPYTAAAIAAIAFREPVPVVDGNVFRVLARIFGVEEDIASAQGGQVFRTLAQSLVPHEQADVYTQAIMEFGALHCTPAKPKCLSCTFRDACVAFRTARQRVLPIKSKKVKVRQRYLYYLVWQYADQLYMKRRGEKDIWAGLYDFHLVEAERLVEVDALDDALVALVRRHQVPLLPAPKPYKHQLTHQQLYVHFLAVQATEALMEEATPLLQKAALQPFTLSATEALPKSILISQFLKDRFYH